MEFRRIWMGSVIHWKRLFALPLCSKDLPQGNAAVIGWDSLVPIGPEAGLLEPGHGKLNEASVLEAATRKDHPFEVHLLRHSHDGFRQPVVKAGGYLCGRSAPRQI